jgi:hypothetical protein
MTMDDAVTELRRYTLHPGRREALIDVFSEHFIEGQEDAGMSVIGQFRDLADPDRFVWLRGFPDMPARAESLHGFYYGPIWKAHRDVANATMIDSDDVLLLRPAGPDTGFAHLDVSVRDDPPSSLVLATIYYLPAPAEEGFIDFFDADMLPLLEKTGARPIARLCTEYAENNVPALPVRTGEHVFVWFASFAGEAELREHTERLARLPEWTDGVLPRLPERFERLTLSPTARSVLR